MIARRKTVIIANASAFSIPRVHTLFHLTWIFAHVPFWLVTFPIYFGFLIWLFDLTWLEGLIFTFILGVTRVLVIAMLVSVLMG